MNLKPSKEFWFTKKFRGFKAPCFSTKFLVPKICRFRQIFVTLILDSLTVLFIYFLFSGLGKILTVKAKAISQGMTLEQLKVALLTGSVEANKLFYLNARAFVLYFVIGTMIVIFLSLIIYSLSRKLIWQKLLQKHFQASRFWRWVLLAIVQIILIVLIVLVYAVVNLSLSAFGTGVISSIILSLIGALFLVTILCFLSISELSFSKDSKVWQSIINFSSWKTVWKLYLLSASLWFIIRIVLSYPLGWINHYSALASNLLGILVMLLFISGLRICISDNINYSNCE